MIPYRADWYDRLLVVNTLRGAGHRTLTRVLVVDPPTVFV